MDRRSLLQALGATAALAAIPRTAEAADALVRQLHERLAQPRAFRTLSAAQQALVARVADLVIPRTDTPGALDVEVPALIDLLLTEWYDASESRTLLADVDAIDAAARGRGAASFVALAPAAQVALLEALDARRTDTSGAAAGFRELKALTVFGYFTSERVTKDILQVRMVFPRYQGDAPVGA
ncbi:MAG: gluconate 2-dehydrogenase subunit 3 family protein [Gemmatimonadetes bacterium]|nr:gluconate 2-dehydrogenase subunit 3 family protein [Gemmatimonadota bacterium]